MITLCDFRTIGLVRLWETSGNHSYCPLTFSVLCLFHAASIPVCTMDNRARCCLRPHSIRGSARPPRQQALLPPGPAQSRSHCPAFAPSTPRDVPIEYDQSAGSLFVAHLNLFQSLRSSLISAACTCTKKLQCAGQAYAIEKLIPAREKAAEFSAFAENSAKQ